MYSRNEEILAEFSQGSFIIVLDEHREEEGDFFLLAETVTPEKINFLLKHARGMICIACNGIILDKLEIPLMVKKNGDKFGTNFCVGIDANKEITTGVSAFDRAKTIQILANPNSKPGDLVQPGHTFPLRARDPKVRFGHTEAAVEMAKKADKIQAVVICEILNDDGTMARLPQLEVLADKFGIKIVSIADLIA